MRRLLPRRGLSRFVASPHKTHDTIELCRSGFASKHAAVKLPGVQDGVLARNLTGQRSQRLGSILDELRIQCEQGLLGNRGVRSTGGA